MKSKVIYTEKPLPIYEVTELTMEEALFALSTHRGNGDNSGILSEGALRTEYRARATARQH